MSYSAQFPNPQFLSPSTAALRLGVSIKALRLYERHGLLTPKRTAAGWRTYGPAEMTRAAEIVTLRSLGLSLSQIARVFRNNVQALEPALAAHQTMLEGRIRALAGMTAKVRHLRTDLAQGKFARTGELAKELVHLLGPNDTFNVGFDLPWPWGGERFELTDVRSLNYIIGPLGSGKTQLAQRLAETLPNAIFLGMNRLASGGAAVRSQLDAEPTLRSRVDRAVAGLVKEGAVASDALIALLIGLEAEGPASVVVDMVEQGLGQPAQQALMAHLRRRGPGARPLFLMTRSSAILDLAAIGVDETIIFCPANHSPPISVAPYLGAPGYEAVASCLASPDVRARTEGMIAWRPQLAPDSGASPLFASTI